MRIAILGGPGSGKGTQAKMLSDHYRVPQISTGDMLRDAIKAGSDLGIQVTGAMEQGRLVDDEIVLRLLDERLRRKDTKRGFIVDGYPRNIPQAQAFDNLLGLLGRALQIAIYVEVNDDVLVKRISGRFNCENCGTIYNSHFSPAQIDNVCDKCGKSQFVSREDDNPESVKTRIEVYHSATAPLITYYRAQHKLRTLRGDGDRFEIYEKLCEMVDMEVRPLEIKTLDTAEEYVQEEDTTIIAGGKINRVEVDSRPKRRRTLKLSERQVTVVKRAYNTSGRRKKKTAYSLSQQKAGKKTAAVRKKSPGRPKGSTNKKKLARPA